MIDLPVHSHPSVWVVMFGLLAGYYAAARVWGPQHVSPSEPPVPKSQVRLFALGVAILWIGADWPIHDVSEKYLFSVHMLQHFLFSLVAPPLLLLGLPDWLLRKLLRPRPVMAVMRVLTRPVPAFLIFNAYLVLSHIPGFVNLVLGSESTSLSRSRRSRGGIASHVVAGVEPACRASSYLQPGADAVSVCPDHHPHRAGLISHLRQHPSV
jgi:hypothetical protein